MQTAAELTGHALIAVAEQEKQRMELSLQRTLGEYFRRPSSVTELRPWRANLLVELAEQVVTGTGASRASLLEFDPANRVFHRTHAPPPDKRNETDLAEAAVQDAMKDRPLVVVSDSREDPRLADLFDTLEPTAGRAAILVTTDQTPVALFLLTSTPARPFRYRRIESVAQVLQDLAPQLASLLKLGKPHPKATRPHKKQQG